MLLFVGCCVGFGFYIVVVGVGIYVVGRIYFNLVIKFLVCIFDGI